MRVFYLILISFVAFTSLPAGILMVYAPDGTSLGLNTDLLVATPFDDYLIPGAMLAIAIGIPGFIAALLGIMQNPLAHKFALAAGISLVVWILAEIFFIPSYHWLQALYGGIGVLIVLTSYHLMGKAAF